MRKEKDIDHHHVSIQEEEHHDTDEAAARNETIANGLEAEGVGAHAVVDGSPDVNNDYDGIWGEGMACVVEPPIHDSTHAQYPLIHGISTTCASSNI